MASQVKPIPDTYHGATPALTINGAAAAIEFYTQAFGATELMRLTDPNGSIAYAEIAIDNARIMIADEDPKYNISPQSLGGSAVAISLYVDDVDMLFNRATAAGATVRFPVQDQFYGDRSGSLIDPFGHIWIIATHQEDVPPEELQKRFVAMYCDS
jgi:PhnB protein